jgi:hypothetical protein
MGVSIVFIGFIVIIIVVNVQLLFQKDHQSKTFTLSYLGIYFLFMRTTKNVILMFVLLKYITCKYLILVLQENIRRHRCIQCVFTRVKPPYLLNHMP